MLPSLLHIHISLFLVKNTQNQASKKNHKFLVLSNIKKSVALLFSALQHPEKFSWLLSSAF